MNFLIDSPYFFGMFDGSCGILHDLDHGSFKWRAWGGPDAKKMENLICGVHAVYEALAAGRQPIERIHVARETHSAKLKDILDLARKRGVPVRKDDRVVLDKLARGTVHQGIVAIIGGFAYAEFETLFESDRPCVVVLDGVEDPHNLGAVIRTAEATGASGVLVPERHSAPLSATVAKASAGALAHLPIVRTTNLVSAFAELKERGLWIVGVDASGAQLWTEFDYSVPVAIVLGGEHRGLRRLVRERCDAVVRLPMRGEVASLNVSVAAGIVLYEIIRQRS
jgi:23S rRNA (guanosine2251-2'-O)-methyltransferase